MKLQITLIKSLIGSRPNQVETAHSLGLKKINQQIEVTPNEAVLGMIKTIAHLIRVVEK